MKEEIIIEYLNKVYETKVKEEDDLIDLFILRDYKNNKHTLVEEVLEQTKCDNQGCFPSILNFIELLMNIESLFSVVIKDDEAGNIKTVKDLLTNLKDK